MAKATAVMIRPPLAPRIPTALQVQMTVGQSTAINTGMQVNRLLAADPTVVKIVPISTMAFQVSGNRVGSTQVTVWDDSSGQTVTYDVSIK
jgi:Flp pilus assembly secretin CpaC